VEMVRGRLTLLMKNSDLDDMTIAEQEEARKYGSSETSETTPGFYDFIAMVVDEREHTDDHESEVLSRSLAQEILLPA